MTHLFEHNIIYYTCALCRRVIEREVRAKILEYYPEVTPQLIDIIAGLQPDILKLIASTPILDSPPPM